MAISPPRDRHGFEIALICALPMEAELTEAVFDKSWDEEERQYGKAEGDQNTYTMGVIGTYNVVLAHMPGMGKVNAAVVASSLRMSFRNIKLAIVVGICGGVPVDNQGREIVLGDVIVSQTLIQYDFGRHYPTGFQRKDTIEDAISRPRPEIQSVLAKAQTQRVRDKIQDDMMQHLHQLQEADHTTNYPGADRDRLYHSKYDHKHHPSSTHALSCPCKWIDQICPDASHESCETLGCAHENLVSRQRLAKLSGQDCEGRPSTLEVTPMVHFGAVGSADTVMKSAITRDRIAKADNIIGFEMEGAGVWESFPSIVIKGVCDYADSHKNKEFRKYAAATAACYMKAFLKQRTPEDRSVDSGENGPVQHPTPIWHVPFDRLPRIVGREKEISTIQNKLFHCDENQKAAICGLGGVGKSRIAWEVANRTRSSAEPCSVFWIQSSSIPTIEKDIFDVGRKLKIPGFEDDAADRKQLLRQYLEHQQQGKWLMIFDSADDESIWYPLPDQATTDTCMLEYIPKSIVGSVLVTTRSRRVAANFAARNTTHLKQMEPNEAVDTLYSLLIDDHDQSDSQAALDLVNELTCLPLAVVQAAAYMNVNHASIKDYSMLLHDKKENSVIRLLSKNFEDESRYKNTQNAIASTWLISFEQIQRDNNQAMDLLSFMCCLDEKNIPQTLLPASSSSEERIEAIGILLGYSFVTRQDQDVSQTSLYSMHRLVRLATRNWMGMHGTLDPWMKQAIECLEERSPWPVHENRELWKLHLPHVLVLCSTSCDGGLHKRYNLLHKVGRYLRNHGKYAEAIEHLSQVLAWHEVHSGDTHELTLGALSDLGNAVRDQGDWVNAEIYNAKAFELTRMSIGLEHPYTLTSMNNLALTYSYQGRYTEAEHLQVEVLEIRRRVLGEEHPATLTSMSNLAFTYSKQGRHTEAERLEIEVLELSRRVLGVEHPDTLISMNNLALTYDDQGRYTEAEYLLVEVLEMRKRVLGVEHPDTLTSMRNLASIYSDQGRDTEAERLQIKELELSRRVLGVEHPDTLISMNNLALTLKSLARDNEAVELMTECIGLCEKVLGGDHPSTKLSQQHLNRWQRESESEPDENAEQHEPRASAERMNLPGESGSKSVGLNQDGLQQKDEKKATESTLSASSKIPRRIKPKSFKDDSNRQP